MSAALFARAASLPPFRFHPFALTFASNSGLVNDMRRTFLVRRRALRPDRQLAGLSSRRFGKDKDGQGAVRGPK
jgi:hypothetical protein